MMGPTVNWKGLPVKGRTNPVSDQGPDRGRQRLTTGSLTGYVRVAMPHRNRVYAHLFGDELDAVVAVVNLHDIAPLGNARRTGDTGRHVVRICA